MHVYKCARCQDEMYWENGLTPDPVNYVKPDGSIDISGEVIGEGEWHHAHPSPAAEGSDNRFCPDGEIGWPAPNKLYEVNVRTSDSYMAEVRMILGEDWNSYDTNRERVFAAIVKLTHEYLTMDITAPSSARVTNLISALEAIAENIVPFLHGGVNVHRLHARMNIDF